LINHELKKAYLQLRSRSNQQNVNLSRLSKENQQLSREFYKIEIAATLPLSKTLEFFNNNQAKSAKIKRNDDSMETQEKSLKNQEEISEKPIKNQEEIQEKPIRVPESYGKSVDWQENGRMSNELELVYRERLNESEKLKEKYLTKYKNYKQKYPKQDYLQFKTLVEEKEKDLAKLLDEKKKIEEEFKSIMKESHESKQENYRFTEENNQLRKEYFDMERKNELLMEELSVIAGQNDELVHENDALKELVEEKNREIDEMKTKS
jgi:hypothetical protein